MDALLVLAAAAISFFLGLEIYHYMNLRESIETNNDQPADQVQTRYVESLNQKLRRSLRDIAVFAACLVILYLTAIVLQAQVISPSEIDLNYRTL